jgi:hypothetical protein
MKQFDGHNTFQPAGFGHINLGTFCLFLTGDQESIELTQVFNVDVALDTGFITFRWR